MRSSHPTLLGCICALLVLLSGCDRSQQEALGTLEWDRVNNRTPASEIITDILVAEGEYVSAGTVLLTIDDRKIARQLHDLEARLNQAVWRLSELESGPRPENIAEAEARLEAAQATLEKNSEELRRQEFLQKSDFASQQQVDLARSNFLNSRERVNELGESLNELRAGTRIEQIEQSRAEVESLGAQLDLLRLQKEDYRIKAARSGLVDSLPYKKGDRPPAQTVVSTLLAGEAPWARVYVPEQFRSRMEPGQQYRVRIDGQDREFTARLRSVSSEASFTPYYALAERDRSRLSYVAKLDIMDEEAVKLTAGTPVQLLLK